jgi:glutaminyl-peptide cyclotransferase
MNRLLIGFLCILAGMACNNNPSSGEPSNDSPTVKDVPLLNFTIVNSFPHDTAAYTQGLIVHNGQLYESTGGSPEYNRFSSWVGQMDLKTGKPLKQVFLDKKYFGEGITVLNDKLYQLTWQEKKVFVYDVNTLKKIQEFSWKHEGWGITNDGKNLLLSDGGSNLYTVDPVTFNNLSITSVTDNYGPVGNLNELEYINGFVYANRYTTDYIYKIDPASGKVVARADLKDVLLTNAREWATDPKFQPGNNDAVLNGIAFDAATGKIYITGKLWPRIFEIRFE